MFFRECVCITQASGIENISTYSWFLLQFRPAHWTISKMLHHTGRFRIRRVVQAQLFQKSNPDAHYANAAYKFMRVRVVKTRQNIAFFSADAKCKVPIGESGYPIAVVTRGKKVIVGLNAALQNKNLFVLVNWSLRHQSRRSSYLPRRSKDCLFPLTKIN